EEIESRVTARYGTRALEPLGDTDRPFTPDELVRFAQSPLVTLGNHTRNHAILVNYDRGGAGAQIRAGQQDLIGWTGRAPVAIASARADTPSLWNSAARSVFTVGREMPSRAAICLFTSPSASSARICASRAVSASGGAAARAAVPCGTSASASPGRTTSPAA